MKKECEYCKKSLPNYLSGHLFRHQRARIDKHLKECVMCRSECEALKHSEETRRFMKEIEPAEGMIQRVGDGLSSIARLRKIFYRPLWITLIVVAAAGMYLYMAAPRQLDSELDSIVKTPAPGSAAVATAPAVTAESAPTATLPAATAVTATVAPVVPPPPKPVAAAPAPPALEPFAVVVTLAQAQEKTSLRRINEVMRGYAKLKKAKFTSAVREVSGELSSKELLAFLGRIEDTGTVRYNRKKLEALPGAQPVPFVLSLKPAEREAQPHAAAPASAPAAAPAAPAPAAEPAPLATAPTPSPDR